MKVQYAPRAAADLARIGIRSRRVFGDRAAATLETYIRATVARIAAIPESGQRVPERPGVRAIPLIRSPFKIFYTIAGGTVTILHIRHAARRRWEEE